MNFNKNQIIYSSLAILIFIAIAIFYCSPVLSGKAILQPDIVQHKGMSYEATQYQQETGENTYWTNNAFGGMPTYQSGAQFEFDWIKTIDRTIRFLPRPADYIFLLMFGFFILGMVLFKDWKYALVGSIFFAFCAYFFIIIAAGHNAKVHAVAYFAPLVAGILLLYEQKYILGFLSTTLFLGLELSTNHPQMTYYLFLAMVIFAIIQFVYDFKQKKITSFFKATGLLVVASVLALGMNSGRLLSTYKYSKDSIRGKSEVSLTNENNSGLEKDYITQWSYGKLETLNLLIPNLMGGESGADPEKLENYNKTVRKLVAETQSPEFVQSLATHQLYWGNQPFTSGPAYQGAIVVFLFILGLFLVGGKYEKFKWWLLGATILSILLAWGKNLQWFTDLFIDFVPFYDKFRAVSSILVIAEFTMPLLAILCLYVFFKESEEERRKKILFYVGGATLGCLLMLYLFGGSILGFQSDADIQMKNEILAFVGEAQPDQVGQIENMVDRLQKAVSKDRILVFKADVLRSLVFVALTVLVLLAVQFKKINNKIIAILLIGGLALLDGFVVGKRYMNDSNFVDKQFVENPYPTVITPKLQRLANKNLQVGAMVSKVPLYAVLDSLKQKDPSDYRVFNGFVSRFQDASTSYFHRSIGGYSGVKMGRYQDVIDLYFSDDKKAQELGTAGQSDKILNLLNTKYLLGTSNTALVEENKETFGSTWLINNVKWVNNANEEILALKDVNLKETVVLRGDLYKKEIQPFSKDSLSTIKLIEIQPNQLVYEVDTKTNSFAVFSEIFYEQGWVARSSQIPNKLDKRGGELPIFKSDYFLRGTYLPKGVYKLTFSFEPQVIQTAKIFTLSSNIIFILLLLGGSFLWFKKRT